MDAILRQQRMKELADAQRIADLRRMSSLIVKRSSQDNTMPRSSVSKSGSTRLSGSSRYVVKDKDF